MTNVTKRLEREARVLGLCEVFWYVRKTFNICTGILPN